MRWFRTSLIRTRIGRRVLILFLACAVVPVLGVIWVTHAYGSKQLEKQAERSLLSETKTSGLAIIERLQSAQAEVLDAREFLAVGNAEFPERLSKRLEDRFLRLTYTVGGEHRALFGEALSVEPNASETAYIQSRHHCATASVVGVRKLGGQVRLFLFARIPATEDLVVGEIDPEWLWGDPRVRTPEFPLFVEDHAGRMIYAPPGSEFSSIADRITEGRSRYQDVEHLAATWDAYDSSLTGINWRVTRLTPKAEFAGQLSEFVDGLLLILGITSLAVAILSLTQIRRILVPLEKLTDGAQRMGRGLWSTRVQVGGDDEFEDLGEAFNTMAAKVQDHLRRVERLNRVAIALGTRTGDQEILAALGENTPSIVRGDLTVIHVVDAEEKYLIPAVWATAEGTHRFPDGVEQSPLFDDAGTPLTASVVGHVWHAGRTLSSSEGADGLEAQRLRKLVPAASFEDTFACLSVPMRDHENRVIGVLEIHRASPAERPDEWGQSERRLAESLATQAAVALNRNRLTASFRQLFEAVIGMIAIAIDEKSPYTGGHCRRVPVLTMMLADAVQRRSEGPLASAHFSDDELYELKIAALLHDCGKIVTPVNVVDKSTKLEAISDRIELVRARLEVRRRDLLLALGTQTTDPGNPAASVAELEALDETMDFLERANRGGEFMADSDIQRVKAIAERPPVKIGETLQPILSDEEVKNLTIRKGTLNDEERATINHHVVATIKMLDSLPYPRSLRNVPQIAGAHHEKMDGTGYPHGLKREEISLQGRILAISDVFEALTAKDRPYKKPNTLSEALRILGFMKKEGHVDPDLFDAFVEDKVWLRYAEEQLEPWQIDEVILEKIPGYTPAKTPEPVS